MASVDSFRLLFQGRDDAYGVVEGGSVKEPVDAVRWYEHLRATGRSIGIYPMIDGDDPERLLGAGHLTVRQRFQAIHEIDGGRFYVRWGCTDIDNKADPEACLPLARNIQKALKALGISSWIERTKGKGYHVWIFADDWVPAIVMRRALLVAHQIAGVHPTEVNPKQVDASKLKVGLGNYVNLPYAHDWAGTAHRAVLHPQFPDALPLTVDEFVMWALEDRVDFDTLMAAAKLYKEPVRKHVNIGEPSGEATEIARRLPGLAFTIWRDGVLDGRDRSGTLMRLAYLCAEAELSPADALVILYDADQRWGKYHERGDVEQLDGMVERAYG